MNNHSTFVPGFQVLDTETFTCKPDRSIISRSVSAPAPFSGDWKHHNYYAAADRVANITPHANRGVLVTVRGFDLDIPAVASIPKLARIGPADVLPNVNVDFLRCTFRSMDYPDFALLSDLLSVSLSGFVPGRGRDFYDRSVSAEGVTVLWLSDDKRSLRSSGMGTHVIISGDGCRFVESVGGSSFAWPVFLHALLEAGAIFTRFDIYKDDTNSILSLPVIYDHFVGHRDAVASRYSAWRIVRSGKSAVTGDTLYIGNRQSGSMVRFYDKALEAASSGGTAPLGPVVRCELESHAELAHELVIQMCLWESFGWFVPFLRSRLDFKALDGSANISRRDQVEWWQRFCDVDLIWRVSLTTISKSFTRSMRWLRDGVAGTLRRLWLSIEADDFYSWIDAIVRYNEQRKPVHVPWQHVPVDDLLDRMEALLV